MAWCISSRWRFQSTRWTKPGAISWLELPFIWYNRGNKVILNHSSQSLCFVFSDYLTNFDIVRGSPECPWLSCGEKEIHRPHIRRAESWEYLPSTWADTGWRWLYPCLGCPDSSKLRSDCLCVGWWRWRLFWWEQSRWWRCRWWERIQVWRCFVSMCRSA